MTERTDGLAEDVVLSVQSPKSFSPAPQGTGDIEVFFQCLNTLLSDSRAEGRIQPHPHPVCGGEKKNHKNQPVSHPRWERVLAIWKQVAVGR